MRKLSIPLTLALLAALVVSASASQQPPPTAAGAIEGPGIHVAVPNTPGSLWANGSYDDINGLASELNTAVTDARTADDFWLDPACSLYDITQIRATHMTSSVPYNAQLEIYADSGGSGPTGAPLATFQMASATFLGYSQYGWDMVEYAYDTPGFQLPPGKYWVSSIGLGDGSFADRSSFATSNFGNVQLQEGYFLSNYFGFPTWTPASTVYGYYSDYAFDIDGGCAGQNTLTCGVIQAKSVLDPYGRVLVKWRVEAIDQNNVSMPFVLVDADLWWPVGGPVSRSRLTNLAGFAHFPWGSPISGPWTIDVSNMTLAGYTFVDGANCTASGTW